MDRASSKEKHAVFGKYKGRINNYLSKQGYDLKQAQGLGRAAQGARRRADDAATRTTGLTNHAQATCTLIAAAVVDRGAGDCRFAAARSAQYPQRPADVAAAREREESRRGQAVRRDLRQGPAADQEGRREGQAVHPRRRQAGGPAAGRHPRVPRRRGRRDVQLRRARREGHRRHQPRRLRPRHVPRSVRSRRAAHRRLQRRRHHPAQGPHPHPRPVHHDRRRTPRPATASASPATPSSSRRTTSSSATCASAAAQTDVGDRNDSIGGNPIGNIMIDHVSASWGLDENMSMYRHMYQPPGRRQGAEAADRQHHDPELDLQRGPEHLQPRLRHHDRRATTARSTTTSGRATPAATRASAWTATSHFVNNVIFNWRHRTRGRRRPHEPLQHHQQLLQARPATPTDQPIALPRAQARGAARQERRRRSSARRTSPATSSRATSA